MYQLNKLIYENYSTLNIILKNYIILENYFLKKNIETPFFNIHVLPATFR